MSASQRRAIDAIAFELAAALENYDKDTEQLVATWLDMELYQSVSRQVDHMRMLCAALPPLAVPWVNLLISHSELVHCLWKCGEKFAPSEEFGECHARHAIAVTALRERCLWLFTKMDDPAAAGDRLH
jgi:hypothetical protein